MATLEAELAGLDALELDVPRRRSRASRIWAATWPKLGAVAIALLLWQIVVWSGWKPEYVLPGPGRGLPIAVRQPRRLRLRRGRHARTGGDRLRHRRRDRDVHRRRRREEPRPALGCRLDGHRADDDAVDRLVPRGDRALRPQGERDPVRDRHRRRAVGGERLHRRRRQHAADPRARGPHARRQGLDRLPPRGPARRHSPPTSVASSRAGRSRGGACSPASCWCRSPARNRSAATSTPRQFADYKALYATMIVILVIGILVDSLDLRPDRAPHPPALRPHRRRRHRLTGPATGGRAPRPSRTSSRRRPACSARRPCPRRRSRRGCSPSRACGCSRRS